MKVNAMLEKILEFDMNNRYVIGIDGLSRSGKTTVVGMVSDYLKTKGRPFCIFHIDDLIVARKKRYNTGYEQWYEYYQLQWDTNWLAENFFTKLRDSATIELPYYQDELDTHIEIKMDLPENAIILIEGVFLQREEWREYFDYMMYLDCPREIRFGRESIETQGNLKKFQERYWKAEDYYLQKVQPEKLANLVIISN